MRNSLFQLAGILALMFVCGEADVLMAGELLQMPAAWKIQSALNSSTPPKPDGWKSSLAPAKGLNSFWYQQSVLVPLEWNGKRVFLDFQRIEGDAIVFVNDKRAGELLRPGGEIEISSQVKTGEENLIRVFVTRDYTDISRGFEQDRIRYVCRKHMQGNVEMEKWGVGIAGKVDLLSRPRPAGISQVFADTSWRKKELALDLEIDAANPVEGFSAAVDILDEKGAKVLSFERRDLSVPAGLSKIRVVSKWENPHPWELDGGYLYTAEVRLFKNNVLLDSARPFKFGFREIWTDGRKLMMNGHEIHLRLVMLHSFSFGDSSPKGMAFARLMGYNAGYIQNNPEMWWRGISWAKETPLFSQELLDAADKAGFAILLPAPSVSYLGTAVYEDAAAKKDYERETDLYMRHYRNHPGVLSWIVGMNSIGFANEAIAPKGMGRRFEEKRTASGQAKAVATACEIAKAHDPGRLAYSHADGNIGDIAASNFYLNFAPLQEREEWPKAWAQSGNMPYQMSECGQPYTANFWKGTRFLPTEYFAIYFGDKAYTAETDTGLSKVIDYGLANKSGHGVNPDWNEYPVYWDFQRLFVRNTNRAFRMWGINGGWAYWSFNVGYGRPAGAGSVINFKQTGKIEPVSFESMAEITAKPAWVNPNFDIESQANKQLLIYIAGAGSHTDKTHTFYSGETVAKSAAVAWDGPGRTKLEGEWTLKSADGSSIVSGKLKSDLNTGEIKQLPFSFVAPKVSNRTDFTIELKTSQDGRPVEDDSFAITVFPKNDASSLRSRVAIYDPEGKSTPWLKSIGVNAVKLKKGDKLDGFDLLVVAREAVVQCEELPYTKEDVRRGLKVLVLEQIPAVWRGLGFRGNEAMPRRVFPSGANCPVMNGLALSDLTDWRGSPDLLPEGNNQLAETRHAAKWTNSHAIASSMPQIPRSAGFSPLLSAEFDLDYSPLLEWRFGKGVVIFSALDFSGRVGVDPAATLLARNILAYLDSAVPEKTRRVVCNGGLDTIELLRKLGVDPVQAADIKNPDGTIIVIGSGETSPSQKEIGDFVSQGGRVLFLPQSPETLAAWGLKTHKQTIQRVPMENNRLFNNIGPNLLRWRDALTIDAFSSDGQPQGTTVLAGGLAASQSSGNGVMLFCQVSPALLAEKYAKDKTKAETVDTSVIRLEQLLARLFGNLGSCPSEKIATRLATCIDSGSLFVGLKNWNVIGPYIMSNDDGKAMMDTKFSAETMAVAGDTNPNITFPNPNGKAFDWRDSVNADKTGFVNLGAFYKLESKAVAYVCTTLVSDADRYAIMRVGCDWRMKIWVNGRQLFQTLDGKNIPGAYQVMVPLKKGENSISFKIGSGAKGFGFYADISKETKQGKVTNLPELKKISFYADRPVEDEFDPYFFTFW
ncbi:MAG: hypothetical protein WCI51_12025 [Lentisphaerota bacterium]